MNKKTELLKVTATVIPPGRAVRAGVITFAWVIGGFTAPKAWAVTVAVAHAVIATDEANRAAAQAVAKPALVCRK